jgi:hypothetical protein
LVPGGADCPCVLILNKLLKAIDAHACQYAANAVSKYATSTRHLRRIGRAFDCFDPSMDHRVAEVKLPETPFFLHISWEAMSAREIDEERSRLCGRVQDDTELLFAFDWKSS